MIRALLLILLTGSLSPLVAQQRAHVRLTDTAKVTRVSLVEPGLSPAGTPVVLPPSLARDVLPGEMFWTLPLSGSPPGRFSPPAVPIDIMLPLRQQMASEQKLATLRMILGTVQIGGVAYLAYEHIRKHGLFK